MEEFATLNRHIYQDNKITYELDTETSESVYYIGMTLGKNIRHGKGSMFKNDVVFESGFYNRNLKHGKFEEKINETDEFVGQYYNDKKYGFGKLTEHFNNMTIVYEGSWENDMRCGEGKMTIMDGEHIIYYYKGEWLNDMKHGSGEFTEIKNDTVTNYNGTWSNDIKHGHFSCYITEPNNMLEHKSEWINDVEQCIDDNDSFHDLLSCSKTYDMVSPKKP